MKKLLIKIKSLDAGVIIRAILFTASYINQIIALIGMNSFAQSMVYQIISLACTLVISMITAWKNNDFTYMAQLAGKVLHALKDKKLSEDEIKDLLDKANQNITE